MESDSSRDGEYLEDKCCDHDDEKVRPAIVQNYSKKLVKEISLKDLCDGKEVLFEINKDFGKDVLEQDELDNLDDVVHFDSKFLRENRGAPPLNCSFASLASRMVNVTDDGMVKKQLVTSGVGKVVPNNAYVSVHYNFYKEKCELPFDSTYLRNQPEKFRLDQGEAILGLEYAIKTMKKKENSYFFIKWELAFGKLGCPDRIEPECDIIADVTLVNYDEISIEELGPDPFTPDNMVKVDFNRSLNQAKQLHLNGSDEFRKGDIQQAVACYKKALRILNGLRLANEEQESAMLKQKGKCLVNLAVCYNKLGKYELACVACQEVLSLDNSNVKAYFHYGKANVALSNFSHAKHLLLKANRLKPNDLDISKELKKLDEKISLFEMKDKIFWKKAFQTEETSTEKTKEVPPHLKDFESNMRRNMSRVSATKKPYVVPGPFSAEEENLCIQMAKSMNLNFESRGDVFVIDCKQKV